MFTRGFLPAALTATMLLAGCGSAASPASQPASTTAGSPASAAAKAPAAATSAGPASAAATKLLILYSASSIDQMPEWAALDGGYFQKNGLDVELQYVAGGTKTIGALLSGQSQISIQGGNEAMSAVAGGADLVLISSLLPVYAFKFEAGPGIKSIEDIKGKKLGVSTVGGTADVALRSFLRKHNIDPDKDVTIVATGDPTTSQAALVSGAVQGSLSVPPNSIKAEAAGTRPLADLASEHIPNAQNSVTVQRTWLDANRPTAQKLVDSLVQGLARIKTDKPFAEQVMKKYLKYDDQKGLDVTYDFFNSEVWPDYPHVQADQLSDGLAELSKKNDKLKTFNPASMIDDSLVQDAEKRGLAKKA
jgi:NitT/TauT family transport system substrate-binding protein